MTISKSEGAPLTGTGPAGSTWNWRLPFSCCQNPGLSSNALLFFMVLASLPTENVGGIKVAGPGP